MQSPLGQSRNSLRTLAGLLLLLVSLAIQVSSTLAETPAAAPADQEGEAFFEKKIRPVLVARCYQCHSAAAAEAGKLKGGLLLDTSSGARQGGESGPAVVPGKAAESLLLSALRHESFKMPPDGKLADEIIADFEHWITSGATDPRADVGAPLNAKALSLAAARKFWSFQPVQQVTPPAVKQTTWPRTEVDHFILARLEQAGITPAPPAEKRALLRRATFDLTGLPPTPEEVEAFLADDSAEAFAKVVDRLLASPHYGERWGRHWLDVVRYADTAGETSDFPSPHAWRYRNYVIQAFNADKPYNEFVREQLAGDILAAQLPADAPLARRQELKIATGYIAVARRFGFNSEHDHYLTIEDTIDTVGKSLIGLTIGCARCHDHKYDPVSANDYYALYGIFDSTLYAFPGSELAKVPKDLVVLTPPEEVSRSMQQHNDRVAGLQAAQKTAEAALQEAKAATGEAAAKPERLKELEAAAAQAKKDADQAAAAPPEFELAYAVSESKPHNVKLHRRGNPEEPGDEVPRRLLELFGGEAITPEAGSGRLQLADWIASPANPLTARVMVNRIWQNHFGAGLVRTPNDFGTRGELPTHPELLDYLAGRFMAEGWSIKKLHRLLLLSSVYQQSDPENEPAKQLDGENKLLWHYPRRRLTVEELRDSVLAVSGELDRTAGGSHPFPAAKTWTFTQHNPFVASYPSNKRSVYLMNQRIKLQPMQALFDGPDPNSSTPRRFTTTVPTQALFFLNSEFMNSQAAALAGKLLSEPTDEARLNGAYRLLFARAPSEADRQTAAQFFERYATELSALPEAERAKAAWSAYVRVLLSTNEFVYVE